MLGILKLQDDSRPPYAIVDKSERSFLRNDGSVVRNGHANAHYVLATVCGEHFNSFDPDLHLQNRRFWNGWMGQGLTESERHKIADWMDVPAAELEPLAQEELVQLTQELKNRLRDDISTPSHTESVRWREKYFEHGLYCEGFYFPRGLDLRGSYFNDHVSFAYAYLAYGVKAPFCHFQRDANFGTCYFGASADFGVSYFEKHGGGIFQAAVFNEMAYFGRCVFALSGNFSDAVFKQGASFSETWFLENIPTFFQADVHENTDFSIRTEYWPRVRPSSAAADKRIYTRLRQIMHELHKPDEEYFFFRQEMRSKAALEAWPDTWVIKSFGALSDFGFSVARPVMGLIFAWIFPALIYTAAFAPAIISGTSKLSTFGAFGLSFANLFSFLGLAELMFRETILEFGPWLSLLAGLQTVTGFVLLFLLALGLRNRFRMK